MDLGKPSLPPATLKQPRAACGRPHMSREEVSGEEGGPGATLIGRSAPRVMKASP